MKDPQLAKDDEIMAMLPLVRKIIRDLSNGREQVGPILEHNKKNELLNMFEKATGDNMVVEKSVHHVLRQYITGTTPRAQDAIRNIKKICEEGLKGRYELGIVDIYQQPPLAEQEKLLAAPTLIRKLPLPLRKLVGDMSSKKKVIVGLELKPETKVSPEETK